MTSRRHEFTAEQTADLLDELDARLRRRAAVGHEAVIVVSRPRSSWWAVRRSRLTIYTP
jgi:hypothetical protein